ncbi:MAG: hypothetical protein V3T84_17320 [Phycisphaerales bacterium]
MHRLPTRSRIDPGWLFVVGGLVLCVAGILLPAQRDLDDLRRQRAELRHEEAILQGRLAARGAFLQDLDRRQPALIRRLAASQLNLVPQGEEPVLVSSSLKDDIISWVDATAQATPIEPILRANSTLSRLMNGRYRLWLLTAGVVSAFLGLLLDPSLTRVGKKIVLGGPIAVYSALICRIERTTMDDLIARIELLRTGWHLDLALAGRHPLVGGSVRPNRRWREYIALAEATLALSG